jgi:hypothetical protein
MPAWNTIRVRHISLQMATGSFHVHRRNEHLGTWTGFSEMWRRVERHRKREWESRFTDICKSGSTVG